MTILSNARTNAKTKKMLDEFGYEGVIQYLAPDMVADGRHTVCPWATRGCRQSCLFTAGRGNMESVMDSRIRKTLAFIKSPVTYVGFLELELRRLQKRAANKFLTPIARLNGTSDIPWEEKFNMMDYPDVQFYDYTKGIRRMRQSLRETSNWPANYDLTFSFSEDTTRAQVHEIIRKGGNVAVVFRDWIPVQFMGHDVISGMEHDFRFLDVQGCVVGLEARGRARKDETGFVVDV
jgi:hypothetical protein